MKNSILRMSLVIAVVALSVAVFSTPASAQFYVGAKGTAFLPNNSDAGLKDFDTGFGGEAFAGYRFIPYFGLEAGAGYVQTKMEENSIGGTGVRGKVTVSALPVTLTAKGYLPLGERARWFAGAGVGMYFAKAKAEVTGEFVGITLTASEEGDASVFGYHAVLGGEFMVSQAVGLQIEGRWFKVEPEFSNNVAYDKLDIGGIMLSFGVLFQL
jgi:outer membrane protein W